MNHFISVEDLTKEEIIELLILANDYRNEEYKVHEQVFAANLFFEPSTRTKVSFEVAERKLGLETLDFHQSVSSTVKGESLYDTVKTFESIGANIAIVRHEDDNWINELKGKVNIPIINAGSGKKDHPTQSLLDADTIYQEFGRFEGLNIVIAGDIKHSRVARSNAQMLSKLGANVFFTGAPEFMDDELNFPFITIDEAVVFCDVLMLLRIQHERHESHLGQIDYYENFGLTLDRERKMKDNAIILHPAPVNRGVEIHTDLVECERSRIFKQMGNGVYVRAAVLIKQLESWGIVNSNSINYYSEKKYPKMRLVN